MRARAGEGGVANNDNMRTNARVAGRLRLGVKASLSITGSSLRSGSYSLFGIDGYIPSPQSSVFCLR